jgi:hypothetical protein
MHSHTHSHTHTHTCAHKYTHNARTTHTRWPHTGFIVSVLNSIPYTRHIYLPPDSVTLSPVTKLSGHFPWLDTEAWPPCDPLWLRRYFGEHTAKVLQKVRVPDTPFVDACISNRYLRGLIAKSSDVRQASVKNSLPDDVTTPGFCEKLDAVVSTARRERKGPSSWTGYGPMTPKLAADGKSILHMGWKDPLAPAPEYNT